jgi:hypothetical protein
LIKPRFEAQGDFMTSIQRSSTVLTLSFLAAVAIAATATFAAVQGSAQREIIRGTIASVEGGTSR